MTRYRSLFPPQVPMPDGLSLVNYTGAPGTSLPRLYQGLLRARITMCRQAVCAMCRNGQQVTGRSAVPSSASVRHFGSDGNRPGESGW